MSKSYEKEMLKALGQPAKLKKETDQKYRSRLMKAGNKLSDQEFDELPTNLQDWLNDAVNADNAGEEIRDLHTIDKKKANMPKSLVQKHLEKIDCRVLNEAPDIICEFVDGQAGIYALYNGEKLYYVGLADSLLRRLRDHLERDEHRGKWSHFSVYLTGPKYRKDLETLLIRIANPPGCKNRGNFVDSTYLPSEVKAKFKKMFEWLE